MESHTEDGESRCRSGSSCILRVGNAGKIELEIQSRKQLQGLFDDHTVMSDTETSDLDSLWSGSAPSSWTSGSSMSELRSSDLYLSSMPTKKVILGQSMPVFQGLDNFHSGELPLYVEPRSKISGTTTCSHRATLPNFRSEKNRSNQTSPRHHVDYLSHRWTLDDVSASWRFISSNKDKYQNGKRLENASWRGWEKWRSNLRTVTPESLNW